MNFKKLTYSVLAFLVPSIVFGALVNHPLEKFSWRTEKIRVCYEKNIFQGGSFADLIASWNFTTYKNEIQRWVSTELNKADINIFGWNTCGPDSKNSLRIGVYSSDWRNSAFAQFLGKKSKGTFSAVNVFFDHSNSPEWYPRFTVLHEILHTFGFHHEQERSENTSCGLQGTNGEKASSYLYLGDYDSNSVMNYCIFDEFDPPQTFEQGLLLEESFGRLSDGDINALKTIMNEPVAELALPLKNESDADSFELKVAGVDVEEYYYLFGPKEGLNCNDKSLYEGPYSVGQKINLEISGSGYYKLCLLGSDGKTHQSSRSYSSYTWQKVDRKKIIKNFLEIVPLNSSIKLDFDTSQENIYLKVVPKSERLGCSKSVGYRQYVKKDAYLKLSDWVDGKYSFDEFEFFLCASDDEDFANYDEEHFLAFEDSVDVPILNFDQLQDNQLVRYPLRHVDGFFRQYKYKVVSDKASCFVDLASYSDERPTSLPLEFTYKKEETKFICTLALDKYGNWTDLRHARAIKFEEDWAY